MTSNFSSNKSQVEVFTSPTCPHCPSAYELVKQISSKREDIEVIPRSTVTEDGIQRARELQIMSVPTIIIKGPASEEIFGFKGTPSETKLTEAIDISLGLKEDKTKNPNLKTGFFKGLIQKLKL